LGDLPAGLIFDVLVVPGTALDPPGFGAGRAARGGEGERTTACSIAGTFLDAIAIGFDCEEDVVVSFLAAKGGRPGSAFHTLRMLRGLESPGAHDMATKCEVCESLSATYLEAVTQQLQQAMKLDRALRGR